MAATAKRPKLLALVGPTASGKSELGLRLAKHFDGEIICADSRTIYRGLDVATAKPTPEQRSEVPHFGLDLAKPGESFSARKFQSYAKAKVEEIQTRGNLPIIVGGTGLYIDSVIFDFKFRPAVEQKIRQGLEAKSLDELQQIIREKNYDMPLNFKNKRHLIRAIEAAGQTSSKKSMPDEGTSIIGLNPPKEELVTRIKARAESNFELMVSETTRLLKIYEREKIVSAAIPYRALVAFIKGDLDKEQTIEQIVTAEWQYARRQRIWFKRNQFINWFSSADKAYERLKSMYN